MKRRSTWAKTVLASRMWRFLFTWTSQTKELDEEVRRVFDHAGAMLRSLASAAKIVELVRDLYDEYLREHRLESGLPVEPGAAGVREE